VQDTRRFIGAASRTGRRVRDGRYIRTRATGLMGFVGSFP